MKKTMLIAALLLSGCFKPFDVVWRNEREPNRVLHEDLDYCEDWALWRLGTMKDRQGNPRGFQSLKIACMRDKGWQTEVWEFP